MYTWFARSVVAIDQICDSKLNDQILIIALVLRVRSENHSLRYQTCLAPHKMLDSVKRDPNRIYSKCGDEAMVLSHAPLSFSNINKADLVRFTLEE